MHAGVKRGSQNGFITASIMDAERDGAREQARENETIRLWHASWPGLHSQHQEAELC